MRTKLLRIRMPLGVLVALGLLLVVGRLWRIDPATNRVAGTIAVPGGLGAIPGRVLDGRALVWVSNPAGATLYQIDPRRNLLLDERFEAAGAPLAQTADGTAWAVADRMRLIGVRGAALPRTLFAGEPSDDSVTALAAGPAAAGMWAGTDAGTLVHLDPREAS